MNIEIHNPALELRVREQIQRGQFHNVDDLLKKALDALEEKEIAAVLSAHYEGPTGRKGLLELFAESPIKGLDLDFNREDLLLNTKRSFRVEPD